MLAKDCDEVGTVRRLQQVRHFMHHDIFEEILWLLHELRVEADVAGAVVAASPLGFHPLQEIALEFHFQLWLLFLDEGRHDFVQKGLVPLVDDLGAFPGIAAGAHGEGDSLVVKRDEGLGFPMDDGQQVSPPPKAMIFSIDEAAGRFAVLVH